MTVFCLQSLYTCTCILVWLFSVYNHYLPVPVYGCFLSSIIIYLYMYTSMAVFSPSGCGGAGEFRPGKHDGEERDSPTEAVPRGRLLWHPPVTVQVLPGARCQGTIWFSICLCNILCQGWFEFYVAFVLNLTKLCFPEFSLYLMYFSLSCFP